MLLVSFDICFPFPSDKGVVGSHDLGLKESGQLWVFFCQAIDVQVAT